MSKYRFSILVVCLNAGDKLLQTIDSIKGQSFDNYEVVIKDGGSRDYSIERLNDWLKERDCLEFSRKIKIYSEPDLGIYDGMNQAAEKAVGEYFIFINCGDLLYDNGVLSKIAQMMDDAGREETVRVESGKSVIGKGVIRKGVIRKGVIRKGVIRKGVIRRGVIGKGKTGENRDTSLIFYGDIYDRLRESRVPSNPRLNEFACYRNVPCHQACIYHRSLFAGRGYETRYVVRADYEHFLWCFFVGKANPTYLPVMVASYEGGGFSETKENRKQSKKEHKEITARYIKTKKRIWYRFLLWATLAPLRGVLAESPRIGALYNRGKDWVYRR